ncbi:MAG TPA: sulfatase-like hydrolase/transferase [Chitinophagales bacterium]|nr:sulfatase-like hydrolase/transferase [Chitinophagales bacterium]
MRNDIVHLIVLSLCMTVCGNRYASAQATQPNFLFIIVDDLNDYVEGFTDMPQVISPNIKSLIDSGTVFLNNYANAPGCAPSRTSFLSGKDIAYTRIYNNDDYPGKFRDVFSVTTDNELVYTLPQILKDSAGYFTYGINKVFHNPNNNDFDKTVGTEMCEKSLSFNRMIQIEDSEGFLDTLSMYDFGGFFDWGMIPDSLETKLEDYIGAGYVVDFIDSVGSGTANTCGNPFFLSIGFYKPHVQRYIPEKYFSEFYMQDIYAEPFVFPYNFPVGTVPYNGIVMPPQPDPMYADFDALPEDGIARALADNGKVYEQIDEYLSSLDPLPVVNELLTDAERKEILRQSVAANYQMTYMAAVQYIDAQIGRVLDKLNEYPELRENTIIVLIGDNGYSFGEKKHWTKWSLWEPDIRVPLIIADPARPGGQVVNKTVSLLDLYPTFCDLADVNYPVTPEGLPYLDGHSIVNLLDNPSIKYEYPALTSYKQTGSAGRCFPLYSIRSERWHLIQYRQNNDGTLAVGECDSTFIGYESELYEVGENRQTDPYEWNNLAGNPDYQPVVNFLEQWMLDSVMYLKKTFGTYMDLGDLDCFVDVNDGLFVHADFTDTLGNAIALPDSLNLKWYTNKSDTYFYGNDITIDLSDLPDDAFAEDPQLIIYVELFGTDTTIIQGFDLQYAYADVLNEPEIAFTVNQLDALTVFIGDIVETGFYQDAWWDFGDGTLSYEVSPGPHTYASEGDYEITRHYTYGNGPCSKFASQTITLDTNLTNTDVSIFAFPNPADQYVNFFISTVSTYSAVEIFDLAGKKVDGLRFISGNDPLFLTLDTSELKPGMYMARVFTDQGNYSCSMVVMH